MNTIKITSKTTLTLNSVKYRGYEVGSMPSSFGFIVDEIDDKYGISNWFNFRGLTYIAL